MQNKILKLIKQNLNKKGKLECKKALELAKELKISSLELGKIAEENEIRIDNCELAVFGKLEQKCANLELFKELEKKLDEKGRIACKDALDIGEKGDFAELRGTLKANNIDIKYCELGCFKEKRGKKFVVKTKIWIENPDGDLLFGQGKTELLEFISQSGSLLKASQMMGINYKKAWTHLQNLQKNSKEELVITRQGRSENSGTKLTPRALELMQNYKTLNDDVQEYANKRFKEIFFKKNEC